MKFLSILFLIISSVAFGQNHGNVSNASNSMHKIVVEEVIQTSHYTYLNVSENNTNQWVAVPKMEAVKGEVYYFKGGMQMGQFKSKELNRTFDNMLFLGGLMSEKMMEGKKDGSSHVADVKVTPKNIQVEPLKDGLTIAELFDNKEKYANQIVRIRGKVTKFSDQIMQRNWIHLQDGSNSYGNFDLTITTKETVKIGEIVVVEGKVTLDKDFGYGYFYKVLLEEGKIIK